MITVSLLPDFELVSAASSATSRLCNLPQTCLSRLHADFFRWNLAHDRWKIYSYQWHPFAFTSASRFTRPSPPIIPTIINRVTALVRHFLSPRSIVPHAANITPSVPKSTGRTFQPSSIARRRMAFVAIACLSRFGAIGCRWIRRSDCSFMTRSL